MSLILVATDFSKNCSKVLNKAIFLAKQKDFKLKVVHVVEDGIFDFHDHTEKIKFNCMKFLTDNFPEIDLKDFYLRVGSIEDEISKLVSELEPELLVIGASGENFNFEKLIMGSTTKKIIRSLEVPTLVMKNENKIDYKNILMPTDFSDECRYAVRNTIKLFSESKIKLLHVYSVPFKSRLSLYGLDNEHADSFVSGVEERNYKEGNVFIESMGEYKSRLKLKIENDVLTVEHFEEDSDWLNGIDLISIHTTGNISFFTFDMLEKSTTDVLIFKK